MKTQHFKIWGICLRAKQDDILCSSGSSKEYRQLWIVWLLLRRCFRDWKQNPSGTSICIPVIRISFRKDLTSACEARVASVRSRGHGALEVAEVWGKRAACWQGGAAWAAEEKARVELELVHCMYSYMFIHRLTRSFFCFSWQLEFEYYLLEISQDSGKQLIIIFR